MTRAQTAQQKTLFLEAYSKHGNITLAARQAGMPRRSTVYRWQEHDDAFAQEFHQAQLEAKDHIDAEIYRRGHDGYLKPVFQGGQQVGEIREFSDTLLIFFAKGLMPEKYRERTELTVNQVVKAYAGFEVSEV